jgi:hypothetical protein
LLSNFYGYSALFGSVEIDGNDCHREGGNDRGRNPDQAPSCPPWIRRAATRGDGGPRSGGGGESLRFELAGVGGESNDLTATGADGKMREHMVALVRGERALSEGAEQLGVEMGDGGMRAVLGGCGHESACSENA